MLCVHFVWNRSLLGTGLVGTKTQKLIKIYTHINIIHSYRVSHQVSLSLYNSQLIILKYGFLFIL